MMTLNPKKEKIINRSLEDSPKLMATSVLRKKRENELKEKSKLKTIQTQIHLPLVNKEKENEKEIQNKE
jgi:hypothetical protein